MMDFTVDKFFGPLDLLLTLIESEKMDITEISLADIADEYVNYIHRVKNVSPEELADFLVVAAKLLYIKSKTLLPYLSNAEEEQEINDLTQQLRRYREFVEASNKIKELIVAEQQLFLPPLIKNRHGFFNLPVFSPPSKINLEILHAQFLKVRVDLAKRREAELPEVILEAEINIDEKILIIRNLLREELKINFSNLLKSAATKNEVIVNFLAVLELAKQQELIFEQVELFSEINLLSIV